MKIRKRLLVTSLIVAAAASVVIGWAVSRSGGDAGDSDTVVISGPRITFQEPTIGTNARVEGTPFPSVTIQTINGDDLDTGSLAGTPLVVNIWGSTCGPCKQELPDFAAAHARYGDRVRFVGISYLPPSDREESFARDRGVQYELYYDTNGELIAAAGVATFPVTLFVTADGTIVQQTGQLDEGRLTQLIEEDLL